jgi:hypothetical protein
LKVFGKEKKNYLRKKEIRRPHNKCKKYGHAPKIAQR